MDISSIINLRFLIIVMIALSQRLSGNVVLPEKLKMKANVEVIPLLVIVCS